MYCLTVIVSHSPTRGWNLQSQIRVPAGLSIHKFLMRSLSCWILKASRGAEVALVGGQESITPQDVFLSVMITLLVPSCEKGISNYSDHTTYQRKEKYLCPRYFFVCVCVWVRVSLVNNSFTSVVVPVKHSCTGRRPSQVITALSGHSRHSSATLQMCVFSALRGEAEKRREKSCAIPLHNSSKQAEVKRKS